MEKINIKPLIMIKKLVKFIWKEDFRVEKNCKNTLEMLQFTVEYMKNIILGLQVDI